MNTLIGDYLNDVGGPTIEVHLRVPQLLIQGVLENMASYIGNSHDQSCLLRPLAFEPSLDPGTQLPSLQPRLVKSVKILL
jgi:hypothetical protein